MGIDTVKPRKAQKVNNIPKPGISSIKASLRMRIKLYKKRAKEIEDYLSEHPDEWGKFQSEFNAEVNGIFREIMIFEKENLSKGQKQKVEKLKSLFKKRLRNIFLHGVYFDWSFKKPYGYSGDFKIIDDIYNNNPPTTGFNRLFDNYLQMSAICVAVRNRKKDFKELISNFVSNHSEKVLKIMSLGCGPCREVKELLTSNSFQGKDVLFHCYDHDINALDYAKKLLENSRKIKFIEENVLKLAAIKDPSAIIDEKYDLIYSTGLFDYLNYKVSVRLIKNLRSLLTKNGALLVSDVRDKYSNPSVHCMEWVGDWHLIYRDDDDFRQIFIDAGFQLSNLKISYEQQGIMQYVMAQCSKAT